MMPNGNDLEPGSLSWRNRVNELEGRVEMLAIELDEVRTLLTRLTAESAMQRIHEDASPSEDVAVAEAAGLAERPAATAAALPPVDAGWTTLNMRGPRPSTPDEAPAEDAPRMDRPRWAEFQSTQEPPSETETSPAVSSEDRDAARDDVRRTVEKMRAELRGLGETQPDAGPEDIAGEPDSVESVSAHEEAAAADLEPMRFEPSTDADGGDPEADPEDPREKVRRAVEEARAALAAGTLRDDEPMAEEALSQDQMDSSQTETPADPEAARDEVRRAVERARAELAAGTLRLENETDADERADTDAAEAPVNGGLQALPAYAASVAYERRRDERDTSPPSIVIEDPEGRVELVRVYDTLNRVNCSGQAVLLNYTPHSVTVGLDTIDVPREDVLAEAVKAAFGRPCDVLKEGYRLSVTISASGEKAA